MLVPLVPNSPAPVMLTGSPLEPRVRGPCESVLPAQCLGRGVGTDGREGATPDAAASWSAYACEAQPAGISYMCRPCSSRQPAGAYSLTLCAGTRAASSVSRCCSSPGPALRS